jgi:hypothetical protein
LEDEEAQALHQSIPHGKSERFIQWVTTHPMANIATLKAVESMRSWMTSSGAKAKPLRTMAQNIIVKKPLCMMLLESTHNVKKVRSSRSVMLKLTYQIAFSKPKMNGPAMLQ